MISKEHFNTLVKNKDHFYKAMVANGYFMPNKASPFCTLKLMKEMYDEICYCPKVLDTRLEPCLNPPSCEHLVEILATLIETNGNYETQAQADTFNRLAKHMRRNSPDKQWLLAVRAAHLVAALGVQHRRVLSELSSADR